jgi:hypothetical protein
MKKFGIDWQSILTMPVATVLYRFSTEIKTVFYRIKMIQNREAMVPMVLGWAPQTASHTPLEPCSTMAPSGPHWFSTRLSLLYSIRARPSLLYASLLYASLSLSLASLSLSSLSLLPSLWVWSLGDVGSGFPAWLAWLWIDCG